MRVLGGNGDELREAAVALASDDACIEQALAVPRVQRVVHEHPLADPLLRDAGSDRLDAPCDVRALDPRKAQRLAPAPRDSLVALRAVGTFTRPDVRVVQRRRSDPDQHFTCCRLRVGDVLAVLELLRPAVSDEHDGSHLVASAKNVCNTRSPAGCSGLASSGWNCVPHKRRSGSAIAWIAHSGLVASTRKPSGSSVIS